MACILAEIGMKHVEHPLVANQQYPKGSLVRIYGKYGVDSTLDLVPPCNTQNSNRLDPACETTMYYLGIGTAQMRTR
jgi:hypothetical protein